MKTFLRIIGMSLLFINSLAALYGGLSLMIYPDGQTLNLPSTLLAGSIFKSYFFPGLALLIVNGMLSLFVCFGLVINHKNQGPLLLMQGFFSFLFLVVQIGVMRTFIWSHLIFGSIAMLLLISGFGLLLTDIRPSINMYSKKIPTTNN